MRKYTLVGLGALTRSTVGGGEPDKRFEFTNDVLHWLWSWQLQVERHAESTSNDGQGSTPVQKRRSFSKTSYDEHMLTVVGAHLMKAIQRAEAEFGELLFDNEAVSALPLLRNLYEHWDEQRPAFVNPAQAKVLSGKTFVERFPFGKPWSVTYVSNDFVLGGVVPIHGVTAELDIVETNVLALEDRFRSERTATPNGEGAA